jgi:hypothetical protein
MLRECPMFRGNPATAAEAAGPAGPAERMGLQKASGTPASTLALRHLAERGPDARPSAPVAPRGRLGGHERRRRAEARLARQRHGVYVGMLASDYAGLHAKTRGVEGIGPHYAIGVEFSFAAGRLAYTFDLHGPVCTISSACSASRTTRYSCTSPLTARLPLEPDPGPTSEAVVSGVPPCSGVLAGSSAEINFVSWRSRLVHVWGSLYRNAMRRRRAARCPRPRDVC